MSHLSDICFFILVRNDKNYPLFIQKDKEKFYELHKNV